MAQQQTDLTISLVEKMQLAGCYKVIGELNTV